MIALPAFNAVAWREVARMLRQPSRIIASIGTPALFWVFFAGGFADSMRTGDGTQGPYTLFLLPGMVTLTATFSAIFSAISLIHDRHEGFLQSAIVSPAPPWALALGKALGGSIVAFMQAGALVLLAPLLAHGVTLIGMLLALAAAMCATFAITGLGMALAWKVNSVEGFHGVMNLILTPMWLLSGAVFDPSGAAPWLRVVAAVNPLTHITTAMRAALTTGETPALAWIVSIAFAVFGLAVAVWTMARAARPGGAKDHPR